VTADAQGESVGGSTRRVAAAALLALVIGMTSLAAPTAAGPTAAATAPATAAPATATPSYDAMPRSIGGGNRGTNAPRPTRWADIDGPSIGQAAPGEDATGVIDPSGRSSDADEPVKGSTMVALDATEEDVLRSVENRLARARADGDTVVKVGIIGFFDATLLRRQIKERDLPPIPESRRACFNRAGSCPFGTPGFRTANTVASAMYLGAPAIEFHLAEAASLPAMRRAIDWMAAAGVEIMVPLALVPWDDSGDGTGPAGRLMRYAVAEGMYVATPSGDTGLEPGFTFYNGPLWRGTWRDVDGDDWMEVAPGDESLGAYCGSLYGLRWSDWTGRATDYDLYVSDATRTSNGLVDGTDRRLIGGRDQSRRAVPPIEANDFRRLCNDDPGRGPVYDVNGDGFVSFWIRRTTRSSEPARGDVLELMLLNGWVEYPTGTRNVQDPWAVADSPGVFTIGAQVDGTDAWLTASGPTSDGRRRPDLVSEGCHKFKRSALCENGGDDVFISTTIAAGRAATSLASFVRGFDTSRVGDMRWLAETYVSRDRNAPDWHRNEGRGRLSPPPPPDESTPSATLPWRVARTISSPRGTATDLDRTFSTPNLLDPLVSPVLLGSPLGPRLLTITVTGARRAGAITVWGRGQVPSEAAVAHFTGASGTETRTIAVRDSDGIWVRATTGGDVVVRAEQSTPLDLSGYGALAAPIVLRRAEDGLAAAGRTLQFEMPPASSLDRGAPLVAVTVSAPARSGSLRIGQWGVRPYAKGRASTFVLAQQTLQSITPSTAVAMDIRVIARLGAEPPTPWSRAQARRTVSLSAGVPRTIDLGPLPGAPAGATDVLVQVDTASRTAGHVSVVWPDGSVVPLLTHGAGQDGAGVVVRANGSQVRLVSTASVRLTLTVRSHSTAVAATLDLVEPPAQIPAASTLMSEDASVLFSTGFIALGHDGITVWDRNAGTVRELDTDPGHEPNRFPPTLVAIAADGSAVAYVEPTAPPRLFIHRLDPETRTAYSMPSGAAVGAIVDGTADLTRFVTTGGDVLVVSGNALVIERNLGGSIGDITPDGTRIVVAGPTGAERIVTANGTPVAAIVGSRVSPLSADGRSYVNSDAVVITTGATSARALCPRGTRSASATRASLGFTAARVIGNVTCSSSGTDEGYRLIVGSTGRWLTDRSNVAASLSPDGSTVVFSTYPMVGLHIINAS
jgi:hypothetical protein